MNIILLLLLVTEPILVLRRYLLSQYRGCTTGFILNPALYFLLLSYFYFLIPGLTLNSYPEFLGYDFLNINTDYIRLLYLYYNFIFLLTYLSSDDARIKILPAFLIKKQKRFLEIWLTILTTFLIVVLFIEFNNLLSLRQDRVIAFDYYVDHVYNFYKIGFVNLNIIITSLILAINSKKKRWIFYLIPYIFIFLLDYSHGGRAESFKTTIMATIIYVIKFEKIPTKVILVLFSLLIFPSYFQRTDEAVGSIYHALAEIFLTALTPLVVLKNNLSLDFSELVFKTIISPLPGFIRGIFYDANDSYIFLIQENFGMGFGLAGNFVSEALIYGGETFALLSPLIISCVLYFINRYFLKSKVFGFLFVIILIVGSQSMFRTSFYLYILPILYIIVIHLLCFAPILSKKIIHVCD